MKRGIAGDAWRAFLLLGALILPLVIGFVRFASNLPTPTRDESGADAIVVLTGGGDRIAAGLALLEAGKAKRLFISGVHPGFGIGDLLKLARSAPGAKAPDAAVTTRIDFGDTAGDTFGNAVESADWMRNNHFHSMRLVTADYHMRRALIEFHMAAPDIEIIPNPVQPSASITGGGWWHDKAAFDLLASEYAKYLVAKWRYQLSRLTL